MNRPCVDRVSGGVLERRKAPSVSGAEGLDQIVRRVRKRLFLWWLGAFLVTLPKDHPYHRSAFLRACSVNHALKFLLFRLCNALILG